MGCSAMTYTGKFPDIFRKIRREYILDTKDTPIATFELLQPYLFGMPLDCRLRISGRVDPTIHLAPGETKEVYIGDDRITITRENYQRNYIYMVRSLIHPTVRIHLRVSENLGRR